MTHSRWPLFLAAILGILIALISYRFMFLGLPLAFPEMPGHIDQRRLAFVLHVSAAPIALALGAFQFMPGLRARRPGLHRWSGRVYGLAILVGGISGFFIALGAEGGPVAAWGFSLLAVVWVGVTVQAVRLAMAGQIAEHRRWMIRSYALTFAAVTLRLYLPFFIVVGGMDYAEASRWVAWLCWIPNLVVAQWWIARSMRAAPVTP